MSKQRTLLLKKTEREKSLFAGLFWIDKANTILYIICDTFIILSVQKKVHATIYVTLLYIFSSKRKIHDQRKHHKNFFVFLLFKITKHDIIVVFPWNRTTDTPRRKIYFIMSHKHSSNWRKIKLAKLLLK